MTGIDLLRWSQEGILVKLHTSATDLLLDTYSVLCQREISANIILSHALEFSQAESERLNAYRREQNGAQIGLSRVRASERRTADRNFWLTVWTTSDPKQESSELQLVLSCLTEYLGDYPVFLWSSDMPDSTDEDKLHSRLRALQVALLDIIPPERVFSVFGRSDLVKGFRRAWVSRTGFIEEPESFYEALLTFCTKDTIRSSTQPEPTRGTIRKAESTDLPSVSTLCKEFADTSIYFPLTQERARQEAQWLVDRKVVWIYGIEHEAVSICAVSRQSDNVAVLTKVYTTPRWRRKGFAETLVRAVTEEMLKTKQHVVLYVGIHNDAQHIYDRIGYVGLCGKTRPIGVEDVLEIGFRNTKRGHW
ncbi:hypothetical protein ACEPAI_557 [Sanghuangporus weigelae]